MLSNINRITYSDNSPREVNRDRVKNQIHHISSKTAISFKSDKNTLKADIIVENINTLRLSKKS